MPGLVELIVRVRCRKIMAYNTSRFHVVPSNIYPCTICLYFAEIPVLTLSTLRIQCTKRIKIYPKKRTICGALSVLIDRECIYVRLSSVTQILRI